MASKALVTKALFLSLNLLFFALVSCQHYVSKKNPFAEDGDFNSHNSRDPIPIRQESGKHSAEDGERNSHESSDSNNSSNLRESMEDGKSNSHESNNFGISLGNDNTNSHYSSDFNKLSNSEKSAKDEKNQYP